MRIYKADLTILTYLKETVNLREIEDTVTNSPLVFIIVPE